MSNKVDVSDVVFGSCHFQNCLLQAFKIRKGIFLGCCFEDCRMIDSEMKDTYFEDIHIKK